jgi:hypothetical protein
MREMRTQATNPDREWDEAREASRAAQSAAYNRSLWDRQAFEAWQAEAPRPVVSMDDEHEAALLMDEEHALRSRPSTQQPGYGYAGGFAGEARRRVARRLFFASQIDGSAAAR